MVVPGPTYEDRFHAWRSDFLRRHPPAQFAIAWAWLFADAGELDRADAILEEVRSDPGAPLAATLRHAEVLYTRARGNDRDRASVHYETLARHSGVDEATRFHCRLRLADVARGRAIRGGFHITTNLTRATTQPVRIIIETRNGRRASEAAADAYRVLEQTWLRALEQGAVRLPRWSWPVLGVIAWWIERLAAEAGRRTTNGNRRALVRAHGYQARALRSFLTKRSPPTGLVDQVQSLRDSYSDANDLPGAGNCSATLALIAAATSDWDRADQQLARARIEYQTGRTDGSMNAAGALLTQTVSRLIARCSHEAAPPNHVV
jgi:hypothetical protein